MFFVALVINLPNVPYEHAQLISLILICREMKTQHFSYTIGKVQAVMSRDNFVRYYIVALLLYFLKFDIYISVV